MLALARVAFGVTALAGFAGFAGCSWWARPAWHDGLLGTAWPAWWTVLGEHHKLVKQAILCIAIPVTGDRRASCTTYSSFLFT